VFKAAQQISILYIWGKYLIMTITELRQKLHEIIDMADEKQLDIFYSFATKTPTEVNEDMITYTSRKTNIKKKMVSEKKQPEKNTIEESAILLKEIYENDAETQEWIGSSLNDWE
jgi:hypothetical protein